MTETKRILEASLKKGLKFVEPISKYTAIGVGGAADYFFEAKSSDDLIAAVDVARQGKIPFFVLGSGSSVVISDAGFHGLVIKNSSEGITEIATNSPVNVEVDVVSGTSMAKLIRFTAEKSYSGLEGLVGLPGTIGGGLACNAEWFGTRLSDSLVSLTAIDVTGRKRLVLRKDCQFGPGTSRFLGRDEIILDAKFELELSRSSTIQLRLQQTISKQVHYPKAPFVIPLFKHDKGEIPGRLVEAVGLAGHKVGGAEIMSSSPNFIQNSGHATSENILELVKLSYSKVKEKYHTELNPAFIYIGPDSFS